MQTPKVLVFVPTLGNPDSRSLMNILGTMKVTGQGGVPNVGLDICRAQSTPIARNMGIKRVLRDDFTHIMYIDDDTVVPTDCILKLLSLDADLATGVTPMHSDGQFWVNVRPSGLDPEKEPDWPKPWPKGVFEIDQCGASCLLIKRRVFEGVDYPWWQYDQDMPQDPYNTKTEDVVFTRKVKEKGFSMWCDATVICDHIHKLGMLAFLPSPGGEG